MNNISVKHSLSCYKDCFYPTYTPLQSAHVKNEEQQKSFLEVKMSRNNAQRSRSLKMHYKYSLNFPKFKYFISPWRFSY